MTTPLDDQATQLHKAVTALVQRYQFRDRNDICCYGITPSQCYTLNALQEHGTLTMQALADALHLAISTVTRVVDQLVTKHYVARHSASYDRRVCHVSLTDEGQRFLLTIQAGLIAREQAILERIPAVSRDHVIWAIEALAQAVDDWRKDVAHGESPEEV